MVRDKIGAERIFDIGLDAMNHSGYQASVWVRGGNEAFLQIETTQGLFNKRLNDNGNSSSWNLLKVSLDKHLFESSIDSNFKVKVIIGNNGSGQPFFDDLRFYPIDAQMTTYTYEYLTGITSTSENDNHPMKYEYDNFGRLFLIKDFENNVIKKYEYNYKP